MAASYTRAAKTHDKVDVQIWVAFRNEFTHPFIKVRPLAYVAPIESFVLAHSGKNKHEGGADPANQYQTFKNRVIFPPEQK